jgi:iron-sulfur cluster repair protein YtfE (RIC family)
MTKIKMSGLIRLNEEAINSMSTMLMELLNEDKSLKVNLSKLSSFILTEYHSKHFEKAKPRLIVAHQDKKKCIIDKISGLNLEGLEATIKYLEKLKKDDFSNEKFDSQEGK